VAPLSQPGDLHSLSFVFNIRSGPIYWIFTGASKKLAVELDGDVHGAPGQKNHDVVRDAYLEGKGIRVLRFWNVEIQDNLEGVLDVIYVALQRPMPNPHPDPLRRRHTLARLA